MPILNIYQSCKAQDLQIGKVANIPAAKGSGQRLEWTKVRTGENPHCSTDFNKIKNQCEHPFKQ